MKKTTLFIGIIVLIMSGCREREQLDAYIMVDVSEGYLKKELILQDFMDVEYVMLETNDEFLCSGVVKAIGREFIFVTNGSTGDILIFDRNGNAIRKINRKGRGAGEYLQAIGIIIDEDDGEFFVNDGMRMMSVYDLQGNYKRNFPTKIGFVGFGYNFDSESLICSDGSFYAGSPGKIPLFSIISKQDGSVVKEIDIPFEQKKTALIDIIDNNGNFRGVSEMGDFPIIPYHDSWILTEPSSDTVFRYFPDHSMTPFMVRTPSVQSMNPEVFLFPSILTDRYYFMRTQKKEISGKVVPLVYDKQEKTMYEYSVFNDDFTPKRPVYMAQKTVSSEIAFWQSLGADVLVEAFKKGELKGKLKEVAAELEEESNPVIMLVKYRK